LDQPNHFIFFRGHSDEVNNEQPREKRSKNNRNTQFISKPLPAALNNIPRNQVFKILHPYDF